jgi:hypothetical protein
MSLEAPPNLRNPLILEPNLLNDFKPIVAGNKTPCGRRVICPAEPVPGSFSAFHPGAIEGKDVQTPASPVGQGHRQLRHDAEVVKEGPRIL